MNFQENDAHLQFGIDEIYFHDSLHYDLLEKLYQRAIVTLDGEDNIVLKHASHDMILVFHTKSPNHNLIYRFLKFLDQLKDRENYITSNTLFNEEELFSAIKSKKFALITPRLLIKEN